MNTPLIEKTYSRLNFKDGSRFGIHRWATQDQSADKEGIETLAAKFLRERYTLLFKDSCELIVGIVEPPNGFQWVWDEATKTHVRADLL